MNRHLLLLVSLCALATAILVWVSPGSIFRKRSDSVRQPYPVVRAPLLDPANPPFLPREPLKELPTSFAALGPDRDQIQFTLTNWTGVPLIYFGWPGEPAIDEDQLRDSGWVRGGGMLCGMGADNHVIEPGTSLKITRNIGRRKWRTRYFVHLRGPDRNASEIFLGEYFPE